MSSLIWMILISMVGVNTLILTALAGYIIARRGNRQ